MERGSQTYLRLLARRDVTDGGIGRLGLGILDLRGSSEWAIQRELPSLCRREAGGAEVVGSPAVETSLLAQCEDLSVLLRAVERQKSVS